MASSSVRNSHNINTKYMLLAVTQASIGHDNDIRLDSSLITLITTARQSPSYHQYIKVAMVFFILQISNYLLDSHPLHALSPLGLLTTNACCLQARHPPDKKNKFWSSLLRKAVDRYLRNEEINAKFNYRADERCKKICID